MATLTSAVTLVTLFFNNNNSTFNSSSRSANAIYHFYNATVQADPPALKSLNYGSVLNQFTFFPKCCPLNSVYELENRECVERRNGIQLLRELKVAVDLIKYALIGCDVVVDKLVNRSDVTVNHGPLGLSIDNDSFAPDRFCIDEIAQNTDQYVIKLCKERDYCFGDGRNGAERDWCMYKCCVDGYFLKDNACVLMDKIQKNGIRVKDNKDYFESGENYAFLYGDNLHCSNANWLDFRQLNFSIKKNGSLFKTGESHEFKVDEYCLDRLYNSQSGTTDDVLIVCEFNKMLHIEWTILRILVIFTCICFVATMAVYIFVYRLKKLMEKLTVCFCFTGLSFYICYSLRIFYVEFGTFCSAFGYVYYFLMLSRLTWLNTLSYEIWRTLGRVRAKVGETGEVLRKKFMYYTLYAVMVPLVCAIFFIFGDQGVYHLPESIKPYINPSGCAIDTSKIDNYGHYIHVYLPISILITINLVFYIKTVQHFLRVKSDLAKISNADKNTRKTIKSNNKKGSIILRLGLVMGITWIYYIYDYINGFHSNIGLLNTIGDILRFSNVLEGFYFLIIFVVKWKTAKSILEKIGVMKKEETISSSGSTHTVATFADSTGSRTDIALESIPDRS
ncbi:hypothetical protein Trydic_g19659 [Trypoxylus dichotomus]